MADRSVPGERVPETPSGRPLCVCEHDKRHHAAIDSHGQRGECRLCDCPRYRQRPTAPSTGVPPEQPAPEMTMTEKPADFTQSFDARDWARAFVELVRERPEIARDEGTMLGWFANALMRGYDEHARKVEGTTDGR